MPDPNQHDQPVEGGEDTVNRALEKQSQRDAAKRDPSKQKKNKDEKDRK